MDKEPITQGPALERNNQIPANEKQQEDVVFYNVMPRLKSVDTMVEPTRKVTESAEGMPQRKNSFSEFLKKHKIYVICILILAIGGPVAYFGINKIFYKPAETDNLLIKDVNIQNKPGQSQNTNATTTDFTTPQEWRDRYFAGCTDVALCGDQADPDHDGLVNLDEQQQGTDPNNADSDQDGLADGDEVHVFGSNPLNAHTSGNNKFTDADYVQGSYNFSDDKPLTPDQISEISQKMAQFRLHQPTVAKIGEKLNSIYHFSDPALPLATSTPPSATTTSSGNFDQSLEAKQDRDAQRSNTIKNIGIALVNYRADNNQLPATDNFSVAFDKIKVYLKVATRAQDPINQEPYVYAYSVNNTGDDFTLSFFSEVANQVIKKHLADAQKDKILEEAAIYDNQRKTDLEMLKTALLLYSNQNAGGNQDYVFPKTDKYKTALVPDFIGNLPKDPKTGKDYEYQVSETFNSFTLKAVLDNPSQGTTGYLCNQEECREY
jgi:hypothetical protein